MNKVRLAVLGMSVLCATIATKANASGLDTPVKSQVFEMSIQSICMGAQIVCGVEEFKGKDSIHDKTISKDSSSFAGTYRELIVELIKANPRYEWVEHDGVVNVFPKSKLHKGRSPLDKRIETFEAADEWSNIAAWKLLKMAGVPLVSGQDAYISGSGKVSVSLSGVSVRDALNAIVKADGKAMWLFKPRPDGGYIIYVFGWGRSTLFK